MQLINHRQYVDQNRQITRGLRRVETDAFVYFTDGQYEWYADGTIKESRDNHPIPVNPGGNLVLPYAGP